MESFLPSRDGREGCLLTNKVETAKITKPLTK